MPGASKDANRDIQRHAVAHNFQELPRWDDLRQVPKPDPHDHKQLGPTTTISEHKGRAGRIVLVFVVCTASFFLNIGEAKRDPSSGAGYDVSTLLDYL
jgi:hypothetical protein